MKRFVQVVVAAFALLALAGGAFAATSFFQGFESDTTGWFNGSDVTISRVASGYTNAGGYADGIPSASGGYHARLSVTPGGPNGCLTLTQSSACVGPFTRFGGYESAFPEPGYVTQLDIYLDTGWAASNPDRRFDWDSAINDNTGNFLQDYAFNVGTDPLGSGNFYVSTSTNALRSGTYPENPCPSPSGPPNACRPPVVISTSGWYTFRHTFTDDAGQLAVRFTVLDHNGNVVPGADWTIHPGQPIAGVGGHRYGWLVQEEIQDLAIDNTLLRPLATPISMGTQAMEGALKVKPGDTLKAGYDFTIPGKHPAANVSFFSPKVTFQGKCVTGGAIVTLVVPMDDATYTDPLNSSAWYPSGNQKDPSVFQGSLLVDDPCGNGSAISLAAGGTFTAGLTSTQPNTVNVRWHYSSHGSAGGWSVTGKFVPAT